MLISSLALVGIGVTFLLKIFENPEPLQEMLRLGRYEKEISIGYECTHLHA